MRLRLPVLSRLLVAPALPAAAAAAAAEGAASISSSSPLPPLPASLLPEAALLLYITASSAANMARSFCQRRRHCSDSSSVNARAANCRGQGRVQGRRRAVAGNQHMWKQRAQMRAGHAQWGQASQPSHLGPAGVLQSKRQGRALCRTPAHVCVWVLQERWEGSRHGPLQLGQQLQAAQRAARQLTRRQAVRGCACIAASCRCYQILKGGWRMSEVAQNQPAASSISSMVAARQMRRPAGSPC